MADGQEFEPLQLRPIQYIPLAPNPVKSSIDWIPDFAGFGWLAYGAGPVVVIITTQLPPQKGKGNQNEEEKIIHSNPFFQQILQPRKEGGGDEDEEIRSVAWAPVAPSNGALAVGAGESVYVYEPCNLVVGAENVAPELPLAWSQVSVLSHSSRVHALAWTESGDGLLAAGFEVSMWSKEDGGWVPLWKSKLRQPHFLASTTWSNVGLTATATDSSTYDGDLCSTASTSFLGSSKGQMIVWHWNDVSGIQQIELSHPRPISMIQWRPSSSPSFERQVLLTCCLDGAVRLWIEIDSRRTKPDKTLGREADDKHTKPTFYVSAVIEVNQCLNGILGMDISVVWARERRGPSIQYRDGVDESYFNDISKGNSVGSCEWLLGVGPNASLSWWSLHCLDDISPPRCPRICLWKKGADLFPQRLKLSLLTSCSTSQVCSVLVKAFIQRMDKTFSAPPSSADLFELLPESIFSWSRIEPPMSAIGVSNSFEETVISNEDGQKNLSTLSSEILNQGGHSGRIIQVALHPATDVELAASVDSTGLVLIWSLSSLVEPQMEIPTFINPMWKILGRLSDCRSLKPKKYCFLTWAPMVLKESQSLLFLGHSKGFDCVFIRKENTGSEITICHETACTIEVPMSLSQQHLECIHATLVTAFPITNRVKYGIMVLGLGNGGQIVGLWKVWIYVQHDGDIAFNELSKNYFKNDIAVSMDESKLCTNEINLARKDFFILVEACIPKFLDSSDLTQITSIASMPTSGQVSIYHQSKDALHSTSYSSPVFNFATCHSDGFLKLWKVSDFKESPVPHCQTVEVSWKCVGLLKITKDAATIIALANYGSKIATASPMTSNDHTTINIWDAETHLGHGNFVLEDTISLPCHVTALDWLNIGNGQLLLGVAMQNESRVYAQRRQINDTPVGQGKYVNLHIWFCIASISTTFNIIDLSWGPKATLVVVSSKLVCIVSQWALISKKKLQQLNAQKSGIVYSGSHSSESQTSSKDSNDASVSLFTKDGDVVKCSSISFKTTIEQHYPYIEGSMQSLIETIDQIGGPLPVYHPSAVFHCLLTGNRKRAVACLRHLKAHLNPVGSETSHKESNNFDEHFLSIPEMDLSNLLQMGSSERKYDREVQWSVGTDLAISSTTHASEGSWLTMGPNTSEDYNGLLGISEVEDFIATLQKLPRLPGVKDEERIHLFAVLDLLSEINSLNKAAQYDNLDEPAQRFWLMVHFQWMYFKRKMGRVATVDEMAIDSRTSAWACQSDCQDVLLDLCLLDELSWPLMRSLGVGFWFTDVTSLRSRMEKVARVQYLKRKDPKDCALLYMALNRRNVLLGLFKLSKDEKDKPLVGFLARDFQEEKNKAAALKNAYVLKGRHQFELAIAFFLLGGDPSSAVSVCAKNLGDEQLALVICHLIEGSNGPLAQEIISKHILPIAEEKKDYWLASLLQWLLGNPVKSVQLLVQKSGMHTSTEQSMEVGHLFLGLDSILDTTGIDATTGEYCVMLSRKNTLKARIGDSNAASLVRWAAMKTSNALKRCGLPLEALECLSSSTNFLLNEGFEGLPITDSHGDIFGKYETGKTEDVKINWISRSLTGKLDSIYKLSLAMHYMSKLIIGHPYWGSIYPISYKLLGNKGIENEEESYYLSLVKDSDQKLSKTLFILEQKYFIPTADILQALANFGYHHGRCFFLHQLLHVYPVFQEKEFHITKGLSVSLSASELLKNAIGETCNMLARVVLACGYNMSSTKEAINFSDKQRHSDSDFRYQFPYLRELLSISYELKCLAFLVTNAEFHSELKQELFNILDLLTLCVCVSLAWLRRDARTILALIKKILLADIDDSSQDSNMEERYQHLYSLVDELQEYNTESSAAITFNDNPQQGNVKQEKSSAQFIANDCRWRLIGVCLWGSLMSFVTKQLTKLSTVKAIDASYHSEMMPSLTNYTSVCSSSLSDSFQKADIHSELGRINMKCLRSSLLSTLACISAGLIKQLTFYLRQNIHLMPPNPILLWLLKMDPPTKKAQNRVSGAFDSHRTLKFENENISISYQGVDVQVAAGNNRDECFEEVWEILVNHKEVFSLLETEDFTMFEIRKNESVTDWFHFVRNLEIEDSMKENQTAVGINKACTIRNKPMESAGASLISNDHGVLGADHEMTCRKEKISVSLQKPKEVLRRSGELFEAICVNCCNPEQVAVASNRKGLIFLNLTTKQPYNDSLEYLWSNAEWPMNGWAGSESTPIPTFVSQGVGLGSKEGSSLGLGGATVGIGPLPKSRKDSSGVTFGIPGYAGIGAMGLGWGEWEDFDGFTDPPATAENISTRALAAHPSRSLFLVGSSNTHVYLWEFGKTTAIATYGVLPAANVPPPYALASVSAVQFDRYGQRFATAALDGTISAWQLEVGRRSNVRPTESFLCFQQHASDVAFVGASGSILAATGFSANGHNMVIWDTLAPPATCRVSLACHEGGARSLSVFDHDIGSGSISPLIVTGGKGGDIAVHDFRFITTGKTKRQRHPKEEINPSSPLKTTKEAFVLPKKFGEQNSNGMLWYLSKAHLGSISRVSTVPGTSLFLTGSRDGDVKLWDVKTFELLCHWPKIHEKHTFLQPNSRGFGGVVRAAVTDVQVFPYGFLTCGGDGVVKLFQHTN